MSSKAEAGHSVTLSGVYCIGGAPRVSESRSEVVYASFRKFKCVELTPERNIVANRYRDKNNLTHRKFSINPFQKVILHWILTQ